MNALLTILKFEVTCLGVDRKPHKFIHYSRRTGTKKMYCENCLRTLRQIRENKKYENKKQKTT